MQETSDPGGDPALRALKWLVVALTATMTLGVIVVVAVFWARFPVPAPSFPASIALPQGETAAAITAAATFVAVVTEGGEILVYSPDGQTLRQRIEVPR